MSTRIDISRKTLIFVALVALVGVGLFVLGKVIEQSQKTVTTFSEPISKVDFNIGSGTVKFVASAENTIEVTYDSTYIVQKPELTENVEGDTLNVTQSCPSFVLGVCESDVEVKLPPNTVVTAEAGGIEVASMRADAKLTTEGGSVKATEMFGKLEIETKGGDVDIDKLSALQFSAKTDGGSVALTAESAPDRLDIQTKSGDIDVEVPEANGQYKVDSASKSGKLTVQIPNDPSAQRTLNVQSDSGDIELTTKK